MDVAQVMKRSDDGLPKLWLVHEALRLRNEHPEWFGAAAAYVPLIAEGAQSERVIAFLRGEKVLAVAPRWSQDAGRWGETAVVIPDKADGIWVNRLTGKRVAGGKVGLDDLLGEFPVALLARED
jgi:(1->4)-alpha-D-glucan 1-alpha-D-glucosylmutase